MNAHFLHEHHPNPHAMVSRIRAKSRKHRMPRTLTKALLILCALAPAASAWIGELGDRPIPRIVNGVEATGYPTTGVLLVGNPGLMFLTCSATLIGCETVLTAGHCFCSPTDDCQGL